MAGIEPARTKSLRDFKSLVSTYSTTLAFATSERRVERETGVEPAAPTLARLCSTTELLPHELGEIILAKTLKVAPDVGFEPTTNRLTADYSTAELIRNNASLTTESNSENGSEIIHNFFLFVKSFYLKTQLPNYYQASQIAYFIAYGLVIRV